MVYQIMSEKAGRTYSCRREKQIFEYGNPLCSLFLRVSCKVVHPLTSTHIKHTLVMFNWLIQRDDTQTGVQIY